MELMSDMVDRRSLRQAPHKVAEASRLCSLAPMAGPRKPRSRPGARGFTVLEMMVVISIIVILTAMVIAVGMSVKTNSQRKLTTVTLKALQTLYTSYLQEMGRAANTSDANGSTVSTTLSFLTNAALMPQLKGSLNAIPASAFVSSTTVNDGFGNPIALVVSGAPHVPYFQSSGPNGTMGTTASPDADDIFSYDP